MGTALSTARAERDSRCVATALGEPPGGCTSCGALLAGKYCHRCGQERVEGRLTTGQFLHDLARRILRLDVAYAVTIWRSLRSPGRLVNDYLAGRRAGILDPLQYYVSSMFTQILVSGVTLVVAPLIARTSAVAWLGSLGGTVAIKILFTLWAGLVWRLLFASQGRNLGEIFVFTTYVSATISLLWTVLPLIDLAVPMDLARSGTTVAGVTLGIEVVYATYAVRDWLQRSVALSFAGVAAVLSVGYFALALLLGVEHAVSFAPLSVPTRHGAGG
jgi:hypothetical protein